MENNTVVTAGKRTIPTENIACERLIFYTFLGNFFLLIKCKTSDIVSTS